MNYTQNYHLGLPIPAERYDVSIVNANNTVIDGQLKTNADAITNHKNDHNNPHAVTAAQVGLGNVNNTSDANKPVSTAQAQYVTQAVSAESTRAQGVESTLSGQISAEVTRATSAESTLADNLSAEITRATGIEDDLVVMISTETTRAQGAESDLRDYVDEKLSVTYKASGSVFFADLPALAASREGHVYNIKDDFTTTIDFVEGAGKDYSAGTNVAIIEKDEESYEEATVEETDNPSEMGLYELDGSDYVLTADTSPVEGKTYYELTTTPSYFYDVLAGFIDTSDFITDTDYATGQTAGIVKPDGTTVTVDENGVISAIGGGDVSSEEMADVVNILGAKNLSVPIRKQTLTRNGLSFSIHDDGSVRVAGTASQDTEVVVGYAKNLTPSFYTLTGCPSNGSEYTYYLKAEVRENGTASRAKDYGNGINIDVGTNYPLWREIIIFVASGCVCSNVDFKPMLRPAYIESDKYVEGSKTNLQLTKDTNGIPPIVNILGAKNLMPPHPNAPYTDNMDHLDITYNIDGSIFLDGSMGINEETLICSTLLPKGSYILTTGQEDESGSFITVKVYDSNHNELAKSDSSNPVFTIADDTNVLFYLYGYEDLQAFDYTIYPMLRPLGVVDDTFIPYVKTNRQLTMQLNAGGSEGESFNFDSHNGQYGWNESEDRDSATFHPFGADDNFVGTMQEWEDEENKSKYKTVDIIDDADGFMVDTIPTHGSQNVITSGGAYNALKTKVGKSELTSVSVTGDVNNTGSTIHENTYFYLNDELVKAKVDIANGATFTLNTNYEETGDILNSINNDVDAVLLTSTTSTTPVGVSINISKYRLLLLRIANSTSTVVYGSDLVAVDALKSGDVINIIRYFNVLSSNFTGALTYVGGNSFTISVSNSSYVLEVYGLEGLANGSSNAPSTSKADKTDLTSIIESGATASQPIASGKYFYLNGVLARAKTDIASNASFSLNVNYEEVTAGALNDSKSYVGMIIHSTTLDTMAKVVAFYGGTTWIRHSGYFLRGASSGVVANSATSTGGADTVTLTVQQMPSHTHTQNAHQHKYGATYQYVNGGGSEWGFTFLKTKNPDTGQGDYYTANATATNQNTGGGQPHNNVPLYKSVYIWERTV